MSNRVLVVGSTNVDLITTVDNLPAPGETVLGHSFQQAHGGKGANQAVAAARAGANVTFLSAVGEDDYGESCVSSFEAEGIDVSLIRKCPDSSTGIATITVDANGENCIVVASGANGQLDQGHIDGLLGPSLPYEVCVCQLETPLDGVELALMRCAEAGITTILNPAPAVELTDDLLTQVSCLTPNETEAEALTGQLPTDIDSATRAARELLKRGINTAIITLGALGAVLADKDGCIHQSARSIGVVDTTGAGDTFTGTLAAQVAGGQALRQALPYACCAATLSVTRAGAQPSIPTNRQVMQLVADFHES